MSESIPPEILNPHLPQLDSVSCVSDRSYRPDVEIHLVIMTVKNSEFMAVLQLMEPLPRESKILRWSFENNMYYLGRYGRYNTALLACYTAGMSRTLISLGHAVRLFHPQLVVNIGIAWGADGYKLGDVLVADRVVNLDDVKVTVNTETLEQQIHKNANKKVITRSPVPEIDNHTRMMVQECARNWRFGSLNGDRYQAHMGLYLTSNTLLNHPDRKAESLRKYPDAIGGDMESYAVYTTAFDNNTLWLVVKGISDLADGKKDNRYHNLASATAASFFHAVCQMPKLVKIIPTTRVVILCQHLKESLEICTTLGNFQLEVKERFDDDCHIKYHSVDFLDTDHRGLHLDIYHCIGDSGEIITAPWSRLRPDWFIIIGLCIGHPTQTILGDVVIADHAMDLRAGRIILGDKSQSIRLQHAVKETTDLFDKSVLRPLFSIQEYKKNFIIMVLYEYREPGIDVLSANNFDEISGKLRSVSLNAIQAKLQDYMGLQPSETRRLVNELSHSNEISYCNRSDRYYLDDFQCRGLTRRLRLKAPKVHFGGMASNSAIRPNMLPQDWINLANELNQRDMIAVDEEESRLHEIAKNIRSYSMQTLIVKGINNLVGSVKDEQLHNYGVRAPTVFVYQLLKRFGYMLAFKSRESYDRRMIINNNGISLKQHRIERGSMPQEAINVDNPQKEPLEGKVRNNLTKRVDYFKTRGLERLKNRIRLLQVHSTHWSICAITGVAGCGKTELAKAYSLDIPDSDATFRWQLNPDSDGGSGISYQRAFAVLLDNFNLQLVKSDTWESTEKTHQRLVSMLWQKISRYSSWVVTFDNAESRGDIERYLPQDPRVKGYILVTTRNPHFFRDHPDANFSIDRGLDPDEAIQLLHDVSNREESNPVAAEDLVRRVDYSPLAITIIGSYIRDTSQTTFSSYIEALESDTQGHIFDAMDRGNINPTLESAIRFSAEQLKARDAPFFEVLQSCAFVSNENILPELLSELFQNKNNLHGSGDLTTYLSQRNSYSLITYDKDKQSYYLHRTTQRVLRMSVDSPVKVLKEVAGVILKLCVYDTYSIQQIKKLQQMESHLLQLNKYITSDPVTESNLVKESQDLWLLLGQLAYEYHQHSQALKYLDKAWQLGQQTQDLQTQIEILRCQGNNYYFLSQYRQARPYLQKAAELINQSLDPTDWHRARIYNDLGDVLEEGPDSTYQEALQTFQRAKSICERIRRRTKQSQLQLAFSYRGIGQCLRQTKDFAGAIENYNKALSIRRQHLGEDSPYTGAMYQSLGILGLVSSHREFIDVGLDYCTSREYIQRSLLINEKAYGAESYNVAISCYWMSRIISVSPYEETLLASFEYADRAIKTIIPIWGEIIKGERPDYYERKWIMYRLDREELSRKAKVACLHALKYDLDYRIQRSRL